MAYGAILERLCSLTATGSSNLPLTAQGITIGEYMKRFRTIAASVLAAGLLVSGATSAQAGSGYCFGKTPSGHTTGAKLNWTVYPKGTGKEYHWAMKSDGAILPLKPYSFSFNGVVKDGTSPVEGFVYVSNRASLNTLAGKWHRTGDPFYVGCSRTVA